MSGCGVGSGHLWQCPSTHSLGASKANCQHDKRGTTDILFVCWRCLLLLILGHNMAGNSSSSGPSVSRSILCWLWCCTEIIDKYLLKCLAELCASSFGEGLPGSCQYSHLGAKLNMIDLWLGCRPIRYLIPQANSQSTVCVENPGVLHECETQIEPECKMRHCNWQIEQMPRLALVCEDDD